MEEVVEINIFDRISHTTNGGTITIPEFLDSVKTGVWREQVEIVRNEPDEGRRKRLKLQVANVTPSGKFSTRCNAGLVKHSGFMCMDIDLVNDLEALRQLINGDQYTYASFISVSGTGLAVVVRIDPSKHLESFLGLEKYYRDKFHVEIDKACKDVARARFVSYDPRLYVNEQSAVFSEFPSEAPQELQEEEPWPCSRDQAQKILETIIKSNTLIGDDSYADWLKIGFALAHEFGEEGRAYYHALSRLSPKYSPEETDAKYDNCLCTGKGDVGFGSIIYLAKQAGIYLPTLQLCETPVSNDGQNEQLRWKFWKWNPLAKMLELDNLKFLKFLQDNGFGRIQTGSTYLYAKAVCNIVDTVTPSMIKDFTMDYLRQVGIPEVIDLIHKGSNVYFQEWRLNSLRFLNIDFLRDTLDRTYLFFKNGFVEVTKGSEVLHPYAELIERGKYIWKTQIVSHDFELIEKPSVFSEFIANISSYNLSETELRQEEAMGESHQQSGGRWVRYSDLQSTMATLGYLLHGYKNAAMAKTVIFTDRNLSEKNVSEGGTGKSLVTRAVSYLKHAVQMDGKSVDLKERFAFQQVGLDTQLIIFDDADKKFDFEALFQRITGDFVVERKNKERFTIQFSDSPKMVITTNHVLRGEGNSFERRQHIIEFSDFYKTRKPAEIHGGLFFEQWDAEEWNKFYSFAILCLQTYLQNGLVEAKIKNYNVKKLYTECSHEFVEWVEGAIEFGKEYRRDDLLRDFESASGFKDVKASRFTRNIQKWCKLKGYRFNPDKNGKRDTRNGITYIKVVCD